MNKLFYTFLLTIFFIVFFGLLFPLDVYAQTIIFEDDFSDGFEKWELNSGYWDMWDIVGIGEQAQATVETRSRITQLLPKDEYWPSNILNYEYQLEMEPLAGVDRNIGFSFRDSDNWYEIHFVSGFTELAIFTNGRQTGSVRSGFVLQNGRKYNIKIRFESGHIQAWVDDQQIFDENDTRFSGLNAGKILLRAGTGAIAPTIVKFDSIIVRDLDIPEETKLPVTLFKQSDPLWKDHEYNSGNSWSNRPNIGRWGCAMSSAAMLLDYFGLNNFPSGLEYLTDDSHADSGQVSVNPGTLNNWLKNQRDGYIGEGALNWMAVTRLSREISDEYSTPDTKLPKLEYSRVNNSAPSGDLGRQLLPAAQEIDQSKPVIVQIDGHFLVGSGIVGQYTQGDANVEDIYIHDPAYRYSKFSQHNTNLISTRLLTPSFTDLSYIMLVVPQGYTLSINDENGDEINALETFTEYIHPDELDEDHINGGYINVDEQTKSHIITQWAKPITGSYTISLAQDSGDESLSIEPFSIEIYAYDLLANPTIFHQRGWIGSEEKSYILDYNKDGDSKIIPQVSWSVLREDISNLYDANHLSKWYVWNRLDEVSKYAEEYVNGLNEDSIYKKSIEDQTRYSNFLKKELTRFEKYFSTEGYEYITSQRSYLESSFSQ